MPVESAVYSIEAGGSKSTFKTDAKGSIQLKKNIYLLKAEKGGSGLILFAVVVLAVIAGLYLVIYRRTKVRR